MIGDVTALLRSTLDKTEKGFEQMNEALKEQAEVPAEAEPY